MIQNQFPLLTPWFNLGKWLRLIISVWKMGSITPHRIINCEHHDENFTLQCLLHKEYSEGEFLIHSLSNQWRVGSCTHWLSSFFLFVCSWKWKSVLPTVTTITPSFPHFKFLLRFLFLSAAFGWVTWLHVNIMQKTVKLSFVLLK